MFGYFNLKKSQVNLTLIIVFILSSTFSLALFADDQVLGERIANTQERAT